MRVHATVTPCFSDAHAACMPCSWCQAEITWVTFHDFWILYHSPRRQCRQENARSSSVICDNTRKCLLNLISSSVSSVNWTAWLFTSVCCQHKNSRGNVERVLFYSHFVYWLHREWKWEDFELWRSSFHVRQMQNFSPLFLFFSFFFSSFKITLKVQKLKAKCTCS